MRAPLAIAVAQPLSLSYEVALNASAHAEAIRSSGTRVVVFPELSLTGYDFDAATIDIDDPRLKPIVDACAETGSLALVGAPVRDQDGRPCIGVLAVDGAGARVAYRKMWLGGAEAACFAAGHEPAVLDVDGWRLGLAICKDTGVAQHASDTAALGMDAYVAGVLEFADDAAMPDQRARRVAREHHVWVAIASFAGSTGGGYDSVAGRSGIWTPDGDLVGQAGPEVGAIVRATLAMRDPGPMSQEKAT